MDSFLRGLKQIPWWLWLLIGFVLLAAYGNSLPEESVNSKENPDQATPEPKPTLTAAELREFDDVVLELDPGQTLVTGVTQWEDSEIVDVTVGAGFIAVDQTQQGEVAIAMRDRLANICECSPYLKFETEGGQRLVEIGRGQPKYK